MLSTQSGTYEVLGVYKKRDFFLIYMYFTYVFSAEAAEATKQHLV